MADATETTREYWPDGTLRAEREYREGIPHGLHREWHENGVLAREVQYVEQVPDGPIRQWDPEGRLIAVSQIRDGTGIEVEVFLDQGIRGEKSWVHGRWTGRHRVYLLQDNSLLVEEFWIRDRQVSRKRYLEACLTDPELPSDDDLAPAPRAGGWRGRAPLRGSYARPRPSRPTVRGCHACPAGMHRSTARLRSRPPWRTMDASRRLRDRPWSSDRARARRGIGAAAGA